ncbi:MAG: hypothetical protein E6J71_17315 [Deltaproteobacteria bacterium]|nr:MAG: hypothetical protein E6J77_06680 [Deltaproteobacteria bacterium]TMB16043.1 MAG: hypothetical protein E6J71_17315 [Deltaproteobacteria bacterium]
MAREARCRRVGLGREIARLTRVGPTWNLSAGRPESRLARGVIPLLALAVRLGCGAAGASVLLGADVALAAPRCGDGIVQPSRGEQCDQAGNPCCVNCRFALEGQSCGAEAACTREACTAGGACVNFAKDDGTACDDGDACTQTDGCAAGECIGADPVVCTALDQCHAVGECDPTTGVCSNPAREDGTACDDGSLCTRTDTCQAGQCTGGDPVVCTALDQCHAVGDCDPASGTCSNPTKEDGAACDDMSLCTRADTCQAGQCTGGDPVVCTALDQCHDVGECGPATGTCSNPMKPDGTTCSDGSLCTRTDSCQAGECTGGDPVVCTVLDQCHDVGECDRATGMCSNPMKPEGTTCDDGSRCTRADTCQTGRCTGGDPVTCTALDQCHVAGECDASSGACSNPTKLDGTTCDDADACTQGDSCSGGACSGTAIENCAGVTLALGDAHAADSFCLDLGMTNPLVKVRGLIANIVDPSAEFEFDGITCDGRASGFECSANEVSPGHIRFLVLDTLGGRCLETGLGAIAHVCLRDREPLCRLRTVSLAIEDPAVVGCDDPSVAVVSHAGNVTCEGVFGDCNVDDSFGLDDVVEKIDIALGRSEPTATQRILCDDNCDGVVDILDIIAEIDALLANTTPTDCTAEGPRTVEAATVSASRRGRMLELANVHTGIRGVELTLTPTGGPVEVLGVRTTRRTRGFSVAFHQPNPAAPVKVILVAMNGRTIAPGKGRIVRVRTRKGSVGRLSVTNVKVAD